MLPIRICSLSNFVFAPKRVCFLKNFLKVCVYINKLFTPSRTYRRKRMAMNNLAIAGNFFEAPQYFSLLDVPRRLFCFGSLVILDVARCYLWLFTLYINIKIGKNSC